MNPSKKIRFAKPAGTAILVVGVIAAAISFPRWSGPLTQWIDATIASRRPTTTEAHDDAHDDAHGDAHGGQNSRTVAPTDDHDHDQGAVTADSIELSAQAMLNLGLTREFIRPVARQTYRRSISVPAVIVEQPGRTRLHVAAPMTGVVTHVHAVEGESVSPDSLLFEMRLTHEDLVQSQVEFLRTLGELDVELKEVDRLEQLMAQNVAITERSLLERKYSRDKLQALLEAQRESLRLHGLSERQVDRVAADRRLLRDLQVVAPSPDIHDHGDELHLSSGAAIPAVLTTIPSAEPQFPDERAVDTNAAAVGRHDHEHDSLPARTPLEQPATDGGTLLTVRSLGVLKGQAVMSGATLCLLADYSKLFIEGLAFEQDSEAVLQCLKQNWPISALLESPSGGTNVVEGLSITYVAPDIDHDSRTLKFYVNITNAVTRDATDEQGRRFVVWRYRPGQRLSLRLPVEEWDSQMVLPVNAVVRDGAEWFVFRRKKTHFDRIPVHVRHHDRTHVVIADGGELQPGDLVAMKSAHQLLMALNAKSGNAVDPHAGHHH